MAGEHEHSLVLRKTQEAIPPHTEFSPYARVNLWDGATADTAATIRQINDSLSALWYAREWVLRESGVLLQLPEEFPGYPYLQDMLDTVQPLAHAIRSALPSQGDQPEDSVWRAGISEQVRTWGVVSPQQNGHNGLVVEDRTTLDFLREKIGLIVHDYRSPLTSILGNLKMIKDLPPRIYPDVRQGVTSSAALLQEIARMSDALLPMNAEHVDLNTVAQSAEKQLQDAINMHRSARGYEPKITVQLSPLIALVSADASQTLDRIPNTGQLPTVRFSHTMIEMLLGNIGQNIVKAYASLGKRPKDGRRATIRFARELANPERWFFVVDDYAAGFPEGLISQGTFPHGFTQWEKGVAGTGLGMYSLSRCIAMMDGRLYPVNRSGKRRRIVGARTTVLLPPQNHAK